MASSPSSAHLHEHAIHARIRRCRLLPQAASTALMKTAELGVEIGDLTALIFASGHRQQAQYPFRMPDGLFNQQIAGASFLSSNSVKTYLRSAYREIHVQTRTQALLWGMDHGLRPAGSVRTWERAAPHGTCRSAPARREE